MAQLAALVVTQDDEFRRQLGRLLRSGGVPVALLEDGRPAGEQSPPDLVAVDIRRDAAAGMAAIERLRATHPTTAIFAVAQTTDPELILQAMRAGANEFFMWPVPEDSFQGAVRRTASRRDSAQAQAKPPSVTMVFFGAKGGAGTTTVAVNCAVELARLTKRQTLIVDLKAGFGEVALFLGVRPAIQRLTRSRACTGSTRIFSASSARSTSQASRFSPAPSSSSVPARRTPAPSKSCSGWSANRTTTSSSMLATRSTRAASRRWYAADTIFVVATPDVPSVRNAQRLVDRVRQLGVGGERIRILLNRASDQHMIGQKQIETALGYGIHHTFTSDYRTVSTALNSGVPLALANQSEIASQFDAFTRQIISPGEVADKAAVEKRRAAFSFSFGFLS